MNICGLSEWKLADEILGIHFKRYDIILLQETWAAEGDEFYLDDYVFHNFPRKYRHKLSIRNSGGLCVYINRVITEGVNIVKNRDDISV